MTGRREHRYITGTPTAADSDCLMNHENGLPVLFSASMLEADSTIISPSASSSALHMMIR